MALSISNNVEVGTTDTAALPANYPAFLDPGCAPTRTLGNWGDSTGFTLTVTSCIVATEEMTWGGIKSLFDE